MDHFVHIDENLFPNFVGDIDGRSDLFEREIGDLLGGVLAIKTKNIDLKSIEMFDFIDILDPGDDFQYLTLFL